MPPLSSLSCKIIPKAGVDTADMLSRENSLLHPPQYLLSCATQSFSRFSHALHASLANLPKFDAWGHYLHIQPPFVVTSSSPPPDTVCRQPSTISHLSTSPIAGHNPTQPVTWPAWRTAGRQLEEAVGDTWKCRHLEDSSLSLAKCAFHCKYAVV
jgi:hypothetical protein